MCCPDLETLFINCKPFYSPREFCSFILVSVYIPLQEHVSSALQKLAYMITESEQQHPDSVLIIFGDFNKANLSRELPKYRQYVTCPTRDSNKLDHCYTAKKDAYHSVPWAALELSAAATDLDELTETVTSYISFCEDMCIPTRTYSYFLTYNNDNPWFTTKLSQLRQAKEDARRNGDRVLYKTGQIHTGKGDQSAKRNYSELFSSSSSDTASVWKGLKNITNFKTPSPSTVENQQLADDLKEFYCRYRQHVTCPTRDSINWITVTQQKGCISLCPMGSFGALALHRSGRAETVTSYISFFEDMLHPTRTYLTYNNDNPWFTAKLSQLRQAKEDARRNGDRVLYKTGPIHTGKGDQSGKEELF